MSEFEMSSILPLTVDGYQYEIMKQEHISRVTKMVALSFVQFEPMAVALECQVSEMMPFVERFCQKTLDQKLSLVATHLETGDLAGAYLAHDHGRELDMGEMSPKLVSIFTALESIVGDADQRVGLSGDSNQCIMENLMWSVQSEHNDRNIGVNLFQLARINALLKGFNKLLGVCTSPVSTYLMGQQMEKMGSLYTTSKLYEDFSIDGSYPFLDINSKLPKSFRWKEGKPYYKFFLVDIDNESEKTPSELNQICAEILAEVKGWKE